MKKMYILVLAMVIALSAGQAFALSSGSYSAGATTMTLNVGECQTRTVFVNGSNFNEGSALVSGGFYVTIDDISQIDIGTVQCYDGTLTPALWDGGTTPIFDPTGNLGGLQVAVSNLGSGVSVPRNPINLCDVQFCCTAPGVTDINIGPIPAFDNFADGNDPAYVYDSVLTGTTITVTNIADPCECSITGPATVAADPLIPVTATYAAAGDAQCTGCTPAYTYTSNCTLGTIDPVTGVLTVSATTVGESCVITATDTACTDVNTGDPVVCILPIQILPGVTCSISIALGRECPGETIDDPAYNRPGRRGLAATCGDIIDFTVCSDCKPYDPDCLVWDLGANLSGSTIVQLTDCCWRMTVGDICEGLDKIVTETVTVTDTCNNGSDSVEIDIGQIIVDIGETTIQPNTESAAVDINLINPNHSVRAITLDIAECDTAYNADNLVCTQCVIDSDRALEYTCSANEQADGSCRVVLYSTDTAAVISQGRGPIAQIV